MYRNTTNNSEKLITSTCFFLCLCFIALFPLLFGNEWVKQHGYILLATYSFIGIINLSIERELNIFFLPSSIIFLYISFSMTIGAWGHSESFVLSEKQYSNFQGLQKTDEALSIFMLTLAPLIPLSRHIHSQHLKHFRAIPSLTFSTTPLYILVLILTPFLFIQIDLSFLGGQGTINSIVRTLISITLIVIVSNIIGKQRYIYYVSIIAINASASSFSKRYAIFLIFTILFLEAYNNRLKFNFSFFLKILTTVIFVFVLIIAMSIFRGYGQYGVDNFISTFNYIDDYIFSDEFIAIFLNNIEANYFYFHSINAIEMVFTSPEKITFGSTLSKFIFIPVPREFFPWKPDSMIHIYTTAYDPIVRARGGSFPINIIAELIWNFWLFAPIATIITVYALAKLDVSLIKYNQQKRSLLTTLHLFIFMNTIILARGGGTDTFFFEIGRASCRERVCMFV